MPSDEQHEPARGVSVGAGAVVLHERRVLLVRAAYGWARGRWLLPNGAQEAGESLAQCAERELREEAGLQGTAGEPLALRSLAGPEGSDTFVAFRVEAGGEPRADGLEVDAARFWSPEEIVAAGEGSEIVRLHRLIVQHALGEPAESSVLEMAAFDRQGAPARSIVYLFS